MSNLPASAHGLTPAQLLRWYVDMGVDIAVDDFPHDRFAESLAATKAPPKMVAPLEAGEGLSARPVLVRERTVPTVPVTFVGPAAQIEAARTLARSCRSLAELRAALQGFDGCALKATAMRTVLAEGNPAARLMLVSEVPDEHEDRQGTAFAGPPGRLLDAMLAAIGLNRSQVYIANVIPWRPPGNRPPTPQEIAMLLPFISRQIELAAPEILVCLGGVAAQTLLQTREGIVRIRSKWFEFEVGDRSIPMLPMLHPAYLLRQPAHKRLAWRDWRALRAKIGKQ